MQGQPKRMLRWVLTLALLLPVAGPAGAGDYEDGKQAWNAHQYQVAYEALWRHRETPYGRNAQVDYMLGTSGCRLTDLRDWGGQVLDWMLRRYALPEDGRAIVSAELSRCRAAPALAAAQPVQVEQLAGLIGATARASGKMYHFVGKDAALNNFAAVRVRDVDPKVFRDRLVPLAEPARAVEAVRKRVPGFQVSAEGRFVLASKAPKTSLELKKIAETLERYLAFLGREYGATTPDAFLTVYFVPGSDDIAALADRLHGLKLGKATLGYSFRDDLSVLAVVSSGVTVGTVQHELLHLAVRSSFGDIPPWLDEGLASLYEVWEPKGEATGTWRFFGQPNWRGKVLWELQSMRPTIAQMIENEWYAFEQPQKAGIHASGQVDEPDPPTADRMAAVLATARYFTLYLQEQGQLKPVYDRLRAQVPGKIAQKDAAEAAKAVVADVLQRPLTEVDKDFAAWFSQPRLRP